MSEYRQFHFENRKASRAEIIDTIRAALEDEGLTLHEGSWGKVTIGLLPVGLVAHVPATCITTRSTK